MRISDWSSDVCSSDPGTPGVRLDPFRQLGRHGGHLTGRTAAAYDHVVGDRGLARQGDGNHVDCLVVIQRPENELMQPFYRGRRIGLIGRSEEHTSELQSLMRISYAVFCLKKNTKKPTQDTLPQ